MDKQSFKERISEIGQGDDAAVMRAELAELSSDVESVFDDNERLSSENESIARDNEDLRKANMKLFTQVTAGADEGDDTSGGDDEPPQKRKFENLFNERGTLK